MHGLSGMLVSDSGLVFTSPEFNDFVKHNDTWHAIKSAPYHAASISLASGMLQTFKVFMKKSTTGKPQPIMLNFFTYYGFEQCSKISPIILNIMPMTTAIMPQFVYDLIIFND